MKINPISYNLNTQKTKNKTETSFQQTAIKTKLSPHGFSMEHIEGLDEDILLIKLLSKLIGKKIKFKPQSTTTFLLSKDG